MTYTTLDINGVARERAPLDLGDDTGPAVTAAAPPAPSPAPLSAAAIGTELGRLYATLRRGGPNSTDAARARTLMALPACTDYMRERMATVLPKPAAMRVAGHGDKVHSASGHSGAALWGTGAESDTDVAALPLHDALVRWGLDWRVYAAPLTCEGDTVEGHVALRRSDTRDCLGVVTSSYGVLQNEDVFAVLGDALLVERGGSMRGGRDCWVQARVPDLDLDVYGDAIRTYALLHASHARGSARAVLVDTRVVCRNTLAHACAEGGAGIVLRHTSRAEERLRAFGELIAEGHGIMGAIAEEYRRMADAKVSDSQVEATLLAIVPGDSTRSENVRQAMYDAYMGRDGRVLGAAPGNAYGLWQGVTGYVEHMRSVRNGADRASDVLLGGGATMRATAWQHVRVLAGVAQ